MSELYHQEDAPQRVYWDRKYYIDFQEQEQHIATSSTVYVGNLNFRTTEYQINETFARVGPIKKIIMGLNRESKMPCGFCFVEYFSHEHAVNCLKFVSGSHCDEQIIRCELDAGFKPGRQYGRGQSGGQVRDERRGSILANAGIKYGSASGNRKRGRDYDEPLVPKEAKVVAKLDQGLSASRYSGSSMPVAPVVTAVPDLTLESTKTSTQDDDDDLDDILGAGSVHTAKKMAK
jgi:RNA recognition motif-containing protein